MSDEIRFYACLAGTNTSTRWLTLSSDGDAKVVLETSASELAQIMRLATLGGKRLLITVRIEG